MTTYKDSDMVKANHIIEIDKQLKNFGSKVKRDYLNGEDHSLAIVLYLACGGGNFNISLDDINTIEHSEFKIECSHGNSINRQKNN